MSDAADGTGMRRTFIVPTITSFDHYDFTRAKIKCSLTWLVAKAFGSDAVPEELAEPFYLDQYSQEHLKPPVCSLLRSAELYCRAGSLILRSDAVKPLLGHNAVIQALAQKCLYVTDQDRLVTERDLTASPIQMSSHLALIDALMTAYTVEMVSVERVMSCIHRCSSAEPSLAGAHAQELPYDTEDAVTTWINKVNQHLRDILVEEQRLREAFCQENNATHKARYRRERSQQRSTATAAPLPLVENLLKDNADGCSLAALLHFYCPRAVFMDDICLKETMSLADSLYNLQLVQDFCRDNLNHCCHFSLEDMLYTHASVKSNYLVFMAELFWWFEVVKPSFVQPRVFDPQACEPVPASRNMAPVSSPVKQSYADRPGSPELASAEGAMKRSNSMSYVDGCVGTWPKENRSRGISFEIPLDGDLSGLSVEGPSHRGGMTRSASSDGLGVNGQNDSRHITEEEEDFSSHKPLGRNNTFSVKNQSRYPNGGLPDGDDNDSQGNHIPTTPPSIEEALKIIHNSERPHASMGLGAADNGFFLHGAEGSSTGRPGPPGPGGDPGSPTKADHEPNSLSTDEVDTGIHVRTEDIQSLDEDSSSLRDYSDIDPDFEATTRSCPLPDRSAATLPRSHTVSPVSSMGGWSGGGIVRMTSFAEQKFRKLEGRSSGGTTPENSELNMSYPRPSAGPPLPITSPATPSPRDPSQMLASEMVHLKMKLEEKRRAIEAQKKKVEAAFTRHRQRMGRTAFLNVASELASLGRAERCKPDGAAPKSPCEDGVGSGEIDIGEYTRSIERLNTSLGFLQTEMQRLASQQEKIMAMREKQTWVIPPPAPSPHRQLRDLRSSSVVGRGSVGSLSPILSSSGSPRDPNRSPAGIKRRPASFHARTPRTPRPNDLKVTPFSRMLNTPTSVDSLPRLRRFSPSQTQTSSFAYLGHDEGPVATDKQDNQDNQHGDKSQEEVDGKSAGTLPSPTERPAAGTVSVSRKGLRRESGPVKATEAVISSEVLSQPVPENQGARVCQVKADQSSLGRRDLREVPLCQPDQVEEEHTEDGGVARDVYGDDQKMCCGFFFKDDAKGPEDMAAKRAALLKAEEDLQKKDSDKERRDYIKNEYLRRKQLKLMEDMNDVIKPRSGSLKKKPRPKSIHRDVAESPKQPVRITGVRPRGYSVSSVSLASLNLGDNDSNQSDNRRTPRGNKVASGHISFFLSSPKERKGRPDSAGGFSSCPSAGSRNGEKDWENESTTSSTPSNTEYTGPKLYKEPSAKSNKHIIQNALAHCCLAGKVNEGQKTKILDEMEKSEANNFLVLFRDAGCQFRSVYTYCPETEEMTKLAGIGPRSITTKMVEGLYKYNSDRKQFSHIPAKTMSASVDAITIASHLWQTKKQSTPKKLQPK
ncbi:hypothetical protein NHX12_003830 [Muraenolepis orangiensis]|uniref:Calmodulin regulated spectrin-associated protein family, member 2b n=1 Tax=Muraenolepis orangiensis TaxID=630683 RepID=A0A9Q0IE55_9TELE|nr:hypothetical protein NHX12_003830 [Muraenolepis orangiensis]